MDRPKNGGFPYSGDNKRYHTLAYYFRRYFGCRVAKIPVNTGATCPNRDGTKGFGGCAFCGAGAGEFAGRPGESLEAQYEKGKSLMCRKWPESKYIVYFQAFTNTWMPLAHLKAWVEAARRLPDVVGISIATRCDALSPEIADYLAEVSLRTWLCVELGLQTVHDGTAARLNRGHSYEEFLHGFGLLRARGINVCVHMINGLPGENKAMMLESARRIGALRPHSVKLHMLHIVYGAPLAAEYALAPFPLPTMGEYVDILCGQLELLPPETVVQRITGDPVRKELVAPAWVLDKLAVRNALDREMARRETVQGRLC